VGVGTVFRSGIIVGDLCRILPENRID
jgi:hypothetical protein